MGKVRIKQVSTGLEELEKKKNGALPIRAPGLKAGERTVVAAETAQKTSKSPDVKSRSRLHPRQQHGRSARYKKALKGCTFNKVKGATLQKAIQLVQKTATAKFPESIEAHINVLKTGLRTTVSLPYSTGKQRSILLLSATPKPLKKSLKNQKTPNTLTLKIAGPEKVDEIKNSGSAPEVDEIWATSDIMKEIATIARILGPAGLMPNPKKGTIVKSPGSEASHEMGSLVSTIKTKLTELSSGKTTLETERKAPIIHVTLGKASMDEKKLTANLEAILTAIGPKNTKKITLASTMGPGIKVSLITLSML